MSEEGQKDNGQAEAPAKKRSVRGVMSVLGALAVLLGGGWFLYHHFVGQYYEETDDAYLRADDVTVSPKVGGYVAQVLVKENQDVKAGQPLVRIDARDYDAQAEQYQAQIEVAKANADAVRAQIDEQQSTVAQMRAQLASARDSAAFSKREVERYAPLVEIGAENAEALATRRNQADQSARQVAAQQAALDNAEKRIASLQAQVRQAEAQSGSSRAQLKTAEVNLESTQPIASVAGRIGDLTVRLGQFVQPGTRLMSIVPLDTLYIAANFKETQIGRMRVGQPVEIKVDALPGLKLRGHVDSLAPGTGAQFSLLPPQNATGNFTKIVQRVPVRIAIDAGPETRRVLVPGLSLKVEVDTTNAKDAVQQIREHEEARK
ncbi:HlyD family efflux transporter periplasmic adaptor subunit [Duganella sp. FT80W]|uniref:HlyD family efflux transporter periplasmic adaptor subunit n=1 Tax=Duganella guangzhouensis TaxID=2666084 RepID=A0A6I2L9F3_9BURK|nr:HlyD family secretion protein [Duganella guangzhouensis]MRW93484.1 HlyD family efflux transporter periplasmic adaptor subunit [Duganella guangzhouensis]